MEKFLYGMLIAIGGFGLGIAVAMGLFDTFDQSSAKKSLDKIQELKTEYNEVIIPAAKEGVHTEDVFITQHFKDIFSVTVQNAVYDYMINSSKVFMDICAVGEKNYKNEEVMKAVFEQTSEILKEQTDFINRYASSDVMMATRKIIDAERDMQNKVMELESNYVIDQALNIVNSNQSKPLKNYK